MALAFYSADVLLRSYEVDFMLSVHLKPIVESLRFQYDSRRLGPLIAAKLQGNATSADIFAVKYEIQRLAKPCKRAIDFRFRAGAIKVMPYEYGNFTHFMDEHSHVLFSDLLTQYRGHYCDGVYETINDYFSRNKQRISELQRYHPEPLKGLRLRHIYSRKHDRLFMSKEILVYVLDEWINDSLVDGFPQAHHVPVTMKTSNASVEGLSIKGPPVLTKQQYVAIRFTGFEDEFVFRQPFLVYQVLTARAESDKRNIYNLKKVTSFNNSEMDRFLENAINGSKTRNNVDIKHIGQSILLQGYCHHRRTISSNITLCVNKNDAVHYVVMSNKGRGFLADFCSGDWLTALNQKDNFITASQQSPLLYFAVNNTDATLGKKGLYGAILDGSAESHQLFEYFSKQQLGHVFYIESKANQEWQNFNLMGLPRRKRNHASENVEREATNSILSDLNRSVRVTPLPRFFGAFCSPSSIPQVPVVEPQSSQCISIIPVNKPGNWVLSDEYDKRKESRYPLQCELTVSMEKKSISANMVNVSVSGVLCQSASGRAWNIPEGTIVTVSFDSLVNKVSKYDLSSCQYEVVDCANDTLRLKAFEGATNQVTRFWNAYLNMRKNQQGNKVLANHPVGLRLALSNALSAFQSMMTVTYTVLNNRPVFQRVIMPVKGSSFWCVRGIEKLNALLTCETIFNYFKQQPIAQCETLVVANFTDVHSVQKCYVMSDKNVALIRQKLEQECASLADLSQWRILSLHGNVPEKLDFKPFVPEMKYVKRFSPHRYETIMQELTGMSGFLSITDISASLGLPTSEAE